METPEQKAQEYIDKATVRVYDPQLVRKYLKRGSCSQERFDRLIEITAKTGALIIPFRELPQVKEVLDEADT